LVNDQTELER